MARERRAGPRCARGSEKAPAGRGFGAICPASLTSLAPSRTPSGGPTAIAWRGLGPKVGLFRLRAAPREIRQEGFREGKVTETALKSLIEVGKELQATTAAPWRPQFAASRANKAAVKDFLLSVKKKFGRVVWEPPASWNLDDADALADDVGAVAARDPLTQGMSTRPVAYYRLPGPAGHEAATRTRHREARRAGAHVQEQGRDLRLHQRRHVRRRQAAEEGHQGVAAAGDDGRRGVPAR